MLRFILLLLVASVLRVPLFSQFTPETHEQKRQACIASLSGFLKDADLKPPQYPADLNEVTIEYIETGCLGTCPIFTLTLTKAGADWEGRKYVRAKGKRRAKIAQQQFEDFLHAWYEARVFAMREDYCSIECPDGTTGVVMDIPEFWISLKSPGYEKHVHECYDTVNGIPETPKPPQEYFELKRKLREFAKTRKWLR